MRLVESRLISVCMVLSLIILGFIGIFVIDGVFEDNGAGAAKIINDENGNENTIINGSMKADDDGNGSNNNILWLILIVIIIAFVIYIFLKNKKPSQTIEKIEIKDVLQKPHGHQPMLIAQPLLPISDKYQPKLIMHLPYTLQSQQLIPDMSPPKKWRT